VEASEVWGPGRVDPGGATITGIHHREDMVLEQRRYQAYLHQASDEPLVLPGVCAAVQKSQARVRFPPSKTSCSDKDRETMAIFLSATLLRFQPLRPSLIPTPVYSHPYSCFSIQIGNRPAGSPTVHMKWMSVYELYRDGKFASNNLP